MQNQWYCPHAKSLCFEMFLSLLCQLTLVGMARGDLHVFRCSVKKKWCWQSSHTIVSTSAFAVLLEYSSVLALGKKKWTESLMVNDHNLNLMILWRHVQAYYVKVAEPYSHLCCVYVAHSVLHNADHTLLYTARYSLFRDKAWNIATSTG